MNYDYICFDESQSLHIIHCILSPLCINTFLSMFLEGCILDEAEANQYATTPTSVLLLQR